MSEIRRTADIAAPAPAVWGLLEDVRRLPDLSPSTVKVSGAPDRLRARGERFSQVVCLLGREYESEWEVTAISPGRHLAIEGSAGFGVRYCLREDVEPLGPDATRLTVTITYRLPFGPLGRLAGKLGVEHRAAQEATHVIEGIKAIAERDHVF